MGKITRFLPFLRGCKIVYPKIIFLWYSWVWVKFFPGLITSRYLSGLWTRRIMKHYMVNIVKSHGPPSPPLLFLIAHRRTFHFPLSIICEKLRFLGLGFCMVLKDSIWMICAIDLDSTSSCLHIFVLCASKSLESHGHPFLRCIMASSCWGPC